MNDGINGSGDTDRLLVRWDLNAADVVAACSGRARPGSAAREQARGAAIALRARPDSRPVAGPLDAARLLVGVPADIESLRAGDPDCAEAWRFAVRDVLGGLLAAGGQLAGFDKNGWYIVTRADPGGGPSQ